MRGASGQYAETDRSLLADDSTGDHSECSGQESGKQHQQSCPVLHCAFQKCHSMTAEEEMGEEELE